MKANSILTIQESLNQSLRIARREFDKERKDHLSIAMIDPLHHYEKTSEVPFWGKEIELLRRISHLERVIKEFEEYDWR